MSLQDALITAGASSQFPATVARAEMPQKSSGDKTFQKCQLNDGQIQRWATIWLGDGPALPVGSQHTFNIKSYTNSKNSLSLSGRVFTGTIAPSVQQTPIQQSTAQPVAQTKFITEQERERWTTGRCALMQAVQLQLADKCPSNNLLAEAAVLADWISAWVNREDTDSQDFAQKYHLDDEGDDIPPEL